MPGMSRPAALWRTVFATYKAAAPRRSARPFAFHGLRKIESMKISTLALAFGLVGCGCAIAQTTPVPKIDAAAKAARSAECNKKADGDNLQGKERKKFLKECKAAQ